MLLERAVGQDHVGSRRQYDRASLTRTLAHYGVLSLPDELVDHLCALNGSGPLQHLDYELNSVRALHESELGLAAHGIDTSLVTLATVVTDCGKSIHPVVRKIYSAGEIQSDQLAKPVISAIATAGLLLSAADVEALTDLGFDPRITVMRDFFTRAHLDIGRAFLRRVMPAQGDVVDVALSHHFSQGFNELGITAQAPLNEAQMPLIRHIAIIELLDKIETGLSRRKKSLDLSVQYSWTLVEAGIRQHYGQNADKLLGVYASALGILKECGVLNRLVR